MIISKRSARLLAILAVLLLSLTQVGLSNAEGWPRSWKIKTDVWAEVTCEGGTIGVKNLSDVAGIAFVNLSLDGKSLGKHSVYLKPHQTIQAKLTWEKLGFSKPLKEVHEIRIKTGHDEAWGKTGHCAPPTPPGSITVHKFHDRNWNGVQDEGEEDIEGLSFWLFTTKYRGLKSVGQGSTDSQGNVTFTNLKPGRYFVWEKLSKCWAPTTSGKHSKHGYFATVKLFTGHQAKVEFGNVYKCGPGPGPGGKPGIDVEKYVSSNGTDWYDADTPDSALVVPVGGSVYFRFTVENTGGVALTNIWLTDSSYNLSSCSVPQSLAPGESFECEIGPFEALEGMHVNEAWAAGRYGGKLVKDYDLAKYLGKKQFASIDIEKSTNGFDADEPTGPEIPVGDPVNWEYVVENTGNVALTNVTVTDDNGTPDNPDDDFVVCEIANLAAGESVVCAVSGTAELGQYANVGTVTGKTDCESDCKTDCKTDCAATRTAKTGQYANLGIATGKTDCKTDYYKTDCKSDCKTDKCWDKCYDKCYSVSDTDPSHYIGVEKPAGIEVTKTANPEEVAEPGGDVTFTVQISNTGAVSVTISTLTDSIHGDLTLLQGTCAVSQTIAASGSYECMFTASVTGDPGYVETDIVTASGTDEDGNEVSDSDDATVTITDVPSSIVVTKTANPVELVEPGGEVTFTVQVSNTSAVDDVTIDSLTDSVHGDLTLLQGTCAVSQTIAASGSYECMFTAPVTGDSGYVETDIVTASGTDDDGNPVSAFDDAMVTIIGGSPPANPSIDIEKSTNGEDADTEPGPTILVGGQVVWTYRVENTGNVDLANVTVTDDNGTPDNPDDDFIVCEIANLAAGAVDDTSCEQESTAVEGQYANVGTVTATYNDEPVTPATDPSHYFGEEQPSVEVVVVKSAFVTRIEIGEVELGPNSPAFVDETVTFRIEIRNESGETVSISGLTDSEFGNLSEACSNSFGDLGIDQSSVCEFDDVFSTSQSHTNTVTVTVEGLGDVNSNELTFNVVVP